ncbi:hypothetical protein EGW08_012387 [Elysia chlorotica]|uniref:BTB domain-containing protein n=1 Tax=Elysia chlorotica TaxID=188477 RepID=A0A3S1BBV3_ELYCH|nr:hypothetical protein EGW08_012387 [Elysia chlorotica]
MSVSDYFSRSILKRMLAQLEEEPHDDIIVKVGTRNFRCHRFILSASSKFFRALCRSGMSEAMEQKVELKDVSRDTFGLILECIYGGKNIITKENALDIWQAASLLQIDFLQAACDTFLIENSDKEDCVDVFKCAKLLSSDHVSKVMWDIMLREFDYLVKSNSIFLLEAVDFERLVESDNLRVGTEDTVVRVIMEYCELYTSEDPESKQPDNVSKAQIDENLASKTSAMKKDKKATRADIKNEKLNSIALALGESDSGGQYQDNIMSTLLGASRLCLASSTCLQDLITDARVLNNPGAMHHVRSALRYHLQPERRYDFCPSTAGFRSGNEWTNVILSVSLTNPNYTQPTLICKRFPQDKWHTVIVGSSPTYHFTQAQCNMVFYGEKVFGTCHSAQHNQNFMFCFNVKLRNFAIIGSPTRGRLNHATLCHKNFLYVVGGDNGELSIERYNLENAGAQWENVGTLAQAVSDTTAAVFNNLIIIVGNVQKAGEDGPTALIQCFDPSKSAVHVQVDPLPRAGEKRVFLKRWSELYLLQEGGDLWQLHVSRDDNNRIVLDYQGRLWNSPVELTSAVIFKEELIVLAKPAAAPNPAAAAANQGQGQGQNQGEVPPQWETPRHELFKRVHVLREDICRLTTGIVLSAAIPQ